MTLGTGASVVCRVEAASRSVHEAAPIPLRHMVARSALETARRPESVRRERVKVGKLVNCWIKSILSLYKDCFKSWVSQVEWGLNLD